MSLRKLINFRGCDIVSLLIDCEHDMNQYQNQNDWTIKTLIWWSYNFLGQKFAKILSLEGSIKDTLSKSKLSIKKYFNKHYCLVPAKKGQHLKYKQKQLRVLRILKNYPKVTLRKNITWKDDKWWHRNTNPEAPA